MSTGAVAPAHIPHVVAAELVGGFVEFDDGEEEDEYEFDDGRQEPIEPRRYFLDSLHNNYKRHVYSEEYQLSILILNF